MNKILLERVRIRLLGYRMFKHFLGKAFKIVAHLVNKSPSLIIKLMTPMHRWIGHPPYFKGLKSFRCVAYAHVKEDKLGPKELKCVFISYIERVKGFKM